MLPNPENYAIWPSIVVAGKTTTMTIIPTERNFLAFEGKEYKLTIIGVNNDETSYHYPVSHKFLTVTAHKGVLKFDYNFEIEQEYLIIMQNDADVKLAELKLYAVEQDLYDLTPLRGDFHSHSHRSDGTRDVSALAGHYREQGYDFFALTDHNRFYPGGEMDEVYAGVKMGFKRVNGEEVHTPGSVVHIVHVGGNSSVTSLYVKDREKYQQEVEEQLKDVPADVPEQYKERYAKAMWATDKIHAAGGLAIFAHPYWRTASRVFNVCDDFAIRLLKSGMFDAYELTGGMGQVGINRSIAMWMQLRAEGSTIPVVGSSDVHVLEKSIAFPHLFTICFATKNESGAICDAVKNGLSVAVESVGTEYERQYRCHGSLRLVSYASFLLKEYFTKITRICQNEGVAMRAYAMGEASKELIEVQSAFTKDYSDRYFGRKPPVLPTKQMLEFEDKWRAVHIQQGPPTKGSSIDGNNRQI